MAALQDKVSAPRGAAFQINNVPITGPGSIDFTLPRLPGAGEMSGFFEADGTVTTLTCALQIALDGASFADYVTSANFISNTAKQKVIPATSTTNPLIAGATYRLNITAASGSINSPHLAVPAITIQLDASPK
jgi:hypothetical protein